MRALTLAIAALLAAGCGGSSGPKPAELTEIENPRQVRTLWSTPVGTGERYYFSPALAGDSVYAAGRDGEVSRIDAQTGKVRWREPVATRISSGVGSDGTLVAVATEDGEVFALEAGDGKVRWRARVSSEVLAAPTVAAGLVLVRTIDARIFAFEAADGKRRWVYQRQAASLVIRAPAGVVVAGDAAYAGFSGGRLVSLALSNGGLRWEATVAIPKGATELERVTDVLGDPIVRGREVCSAAYQGRVACFETQNGRPVWARDLSSLTGVTLDARYAFVSDERGAVHALDRSNGRSIWKQDRLTHRQLSMPAAAGTVIVVGDLEGFVHFLARDSGAFVARYATSGGPLRSPPILLPGGVLVQTQDGGLHALTL